MADTEGPIQYIVKEKSLIGNEIFEAGAIVTLPDGCLPAENLTPLDARGEAKYQEYLEGNKQRVAAMVAQFSDPNTTAQAEALSKAIATAVKDAIAAQAAENADLTARLDALQAQIDASAAGKKQQALA